jgi:hypothetical protein
MAKTSRLRFLRYIQARFSHRCLDEKSIMRHEFKFAASEILSL